MFHTIKKITLNISITTNKIWTNRKNSKKP